ncbi:MAG: response regulator transcription factor [Terriglobales bacterium]
MLVADDTQIHTQLLVDALRRDRQLELVERPLASRDLVETIRAQGVNVVVLSSNLDEEPVRGFEILRELRTAVPGVLAVMLLESSKRDSILQAFRAGARGIFSRYDSVETLSKCIRTVYAGQIWANSEQLSFAVEALASSPILHSVDGKGLSLLSKREMDVVRSLAEGLTNREIGERLGLSQHTIKNYLFRVYDKLGVSSRLELLFMTLTHGGAPQSMSQLSHSRPAGNPGVRDLRKSEASARGRGQLGSQQPTQSEDRGEAKSRTTTPIVTDPLS